MASWHSLRLRYKLLATFLVLGLAPLITASILAYHSASAALETSAKSRMEKTAENAADKIDRNLFERYGDVQAFAQSDPARSLEPARITAWINTMMGTYTPIYKLMVVADARGRIIAVNGMDLDGKPLAATQKLIGRDVSGEAWFKEAMAGRIQDGQSLVDDLHRDDLMASVYGSGGASDLAMSFTAPIKDSSGSIIGVWTNRFNWDVVTTILKEEEASAHRDGAATVRLALASANGTALALPNPDGVLSASLAERAGFTAARTAGEGGGHGRALHDGAEALEGFARSKGYVSYKGLGWVAIATQHESEALDAASSLLQLTVLLTGIAAVVLAAGAWLIAQSITKPLVALRDAADQVSRGAAEVVDIQIASKDEIADLADAFRRMVASVRFLRQRGQRSMDDDDDFGVSAAS